MIYIVDDDESVRNSLTRLMRSAGLPARAFATAEDLLGAPDVASAGCVIVDVHMPGMNGLELQHILARRTPPIPVIVMTAYEDPNVRGEALSAGAMAFLKKPFDDLALLRAVSEATSHGAHHRSTIAGASGVDHAPG
jgi:FixJ family two-component response regulator